MRPVDADAIAQKIKSLLRAAKTMGMKDPAIRLTCMLEWVREAPTIDLEKTKKENGPE